MRKKASLSLVVMVTCLIVGNVIGAGILGLPIKTGLAGFVPSLVGMIIVGGFLFFTATVLGEEMLRVRKRSLPLPEPVSGIFRFFRQVGCHGGKSCHILRSSYGIYQRLSIDNSGGRECTYSRACSNTGIFCDLYGYHYSKPESLSEI